ncbi:MAG: SDR family NAD(P)-dependent oxidoreductase [Gallionellaceae bacterium]
MTGNTILITGGASGIGLALAELFCNEQNTVIIVGRDEQKLIKARMKYPGLNIVQADITNEQDRQRLVADVEQRFPGLNVLVNNAGAAFISDPQTPDSYEKICVEIDTNYLAPVRLIQLFLGLLRQQPSASVINITTAGVFLPLSMMAGYSASKAALHSFTSSLRLLLADTSIKIFEVLPPPVDTEMVSMFSMRKMSPELLAAKILHGLRKDRLDMPIGTARALRWMARLAPRFAAAMSHKQMQKATRIP